MNDGGKVLFSGAEVKAFEKHPNCVEIPAGESFASEVLKQPAKL